jgi:hypothetical protein
MLHQAKTLKGYSLQGLDGDIGMVKEFYFDDHHWTIRYLVAEPDRQYGDHKVLISPHALKAVSAKEKTIAVDLTKKRIQESPSWDNDKPVSRQRQFEENYYSYYGWPAYWEGPFQWGDYPYLGGPYPVRTKSGPGGKKTDSHLRSTDQVTGYFIHALDGDLGYVDDFLIDDETWAIRYLIVDTRNWWPGRKVLISPRWVDNVSWEKSKVSVHLSREVIRQSPEFQAGSLVTREYETELHGHYNHRGYWVDELAPSGIASAPVFSKKEKMY